MDDNLQKLIRELVFTDTFINSVLHFRFEGQSGKIMKVIKRSLFSHAEMAKFIRDYPVMFFFFFIKFF